MDKRVSCFYWSGRPRWAKRVLAKKITYRLSTPKLLTFEELVELEKTDEPSKQLAARLDQLLRTPFSE
jgi:hypothetical protein